LFDWQRTYTFVVAAALIAVLGTVSVYRLSTDIFGHLPVSASSSFHSWW
jgi:hypothetical protein